MNKSTKQSRLLSYLKPYYSSFLIGNGIYIISEVVTQISLALLLQGLVDASLAGSGRQLIRVLLFYSALIAIASLAIPFASRMRTAAVEKGMRQLRQEIFDHTQRLPIFFHEKNHSGDITSRLVQGMDIITQAFGDRTTRFIARLITAVIAGISLAMISWKFVALVLVICIIPLLCNRLITKHLHRLSKAELESSARMASLAKDLLDGIQVSRANLFSDSLLLIFERENKLRKSIATRLSFWQSLNIALNSFFGSANFLVILALGSYLLITKELTAGQIVAATQYSNILVKPFKTFGEYWSYIQQAGVAAERTFALLDEPEEQSIATDNKLRTTETALSLQNLSFCYDETPVMRDITFQVEPNSLHALVGPSGGGKSTLFKLLLGLYPVSGGEICVAGHPLSQYSSEELRNLIAYVPQDGFLFSGSIAENIAMGKPGASDEEIVNAAKMAYAHDFIISFPEGYQTQIGEQGAGLSGGERQRIAIARALLKDAPIILLDEATSGLDEEAERLVHAAIKELTRCRTALLITHRLAAIRDATAIHVLQAGCIVESGTHDELLAKRGLYFELVKLQEIVA